MEYTSIDDDIRAVKGYKPHAFSKKRMDGMWDIYADTNEIIAAGYSCREAWHIARHVLESANV